MLQTPTFCSLLTRCRLPCSGHATRHLNVQGGRQFFALLPGNVLRATTAYTLSTSQLPKKLRERCVLYILTWKLLRATTPFTFSTSQLPKVLREWCDLCVLTWKSETINFLHFSLPNLLGATTACTFSTSQLQKCSEHGVLCMF